MTRDKIISIISDVSTMRCGILAQHISLNESLANQGAGVDSQKLKLDALKAKLAKENLRLARLKDVEKRRKYLEKIRLDHERDSAKAEQTEGKSGPSRVALLNHQGRWIGWVETLTNGNVNVYDARGLIVSRELASLTFDRTGRFVGKGRQGLMVLGQSLVK